MLTCSHQAPPLCPLVWLVPTASSQVMKGQGLVDAVTMGTQQQMLAVCVGLDVNLFDLATMQHKYRWGGERTADVTKENCRFDQGTSTLKNQVLVVKSFIFQLHYVCVCVCVFVCVCVRVRMCD